MDEEFGAAFSMGVPRSYGRQTLLAIAAQPTFGQDGRWNVSQMGNVGLIMFKEAGDNERKDAGKS